MAETILVLDDHRLFAMGVEMLVGTLRPPLICVARADAGAAVAEVEAGTLAAALFVVDYYIPGQHAPDLVRRLRAAAPHVPVLMVSASHSPGDRQAARAAGAVGFVNKAAPPEEILSAIMQALSGKTPAAPTGDRTVLAHLDLTPRQLDIVPLVAEGLSNKEIARLLEVSPETVKTHLSAVFRRLGVAGRVEAVAELRRLGLG